MVERTFNRHKIEYIICDITHWTEMCATKYHYSEILLQQTIFS